MEGNSTTTTSTETVTAVEQQQQQQYHAVTGDTFVGHFIPGCFLILFGAFFLGLTAIRLNRIAAAHAFLERSENHSPRNGAAAAAATSTATAAHNQPEQVRVRVNVNDDPSQEEDGEDPSELLALWARTFCRQHIPENDATVLYFTSLALVLVMIVGLVLESFGGILVKFEERRGSDDDDDDESNMFSYLLHETNTLLFLLAGGMGSLESFGLLPHDSFRGALVVAFAGTAFLWHMHAVSRSDDTTVWIHEAISWLATGTALVMLISVLGSNPHGTSLVNVSPRGHTAFPTEESSVTTTVVDGVGNCPLLFFNLYVASFAFVVWMGTWFITAGRHSSSPLAQDRVSCYFVLQGMLQFVLVQAFLILLLRRYKPRRHYDRLQQIRASVVRRVRRETSPVRVELELPNGSTGIA